MRSRDSKGRFIKKSDSEKSENIKTTKEDGMVQTENMFRKNM